MSNFLDARRLRAFLALAETRSFTAAARRLSLSQSAVSHSIRALEDDVRCRLFDRIGKSAHLTQAGENFLVHAHRIGREMELARAHLESLSQWGQGRIRLGASLSACQYVLPAVLREFKESFPQCVLHIETGETPELVNLVDAGTVDFAMAIEPRGLSALEFQPLFSDELCFIVGALHPWTESGKAPQDEIVRQHYIVYSRSGYLAEMVDEHFRRDKLSLPSSVEMGDPQAIKEFVKLGIGITIMAPWEVSKELAEGSLVAIPLGRRRLRRKWGLLFRPGSSLSLAQETFCGICRAVVSNLDRLPQPEA